MVTNLKTNDVVFIIVNEGGTAVHEAVITGKIQDGHWECDVIDTNLHVGMQKFRRECQIFATREEAQKELDELTNYIAYRMSSHKMK